MKQVNDDINVGSDLEFQRKWWKFERVVWVIFTAIVLLDLGGAFGRGPLSRARAETADGSMRVEYERVARYSTPSIVTVHFGPAAIREGAVRMWASDSLLRTFGVQKVNPEPADVTLDGAGFTYGFKSSPQPNSVQFVMEPRRVGLQSVTLRVPQVAELNLHVLVLP